MSLLVASHCVCFAVHSSGGSHIAVLDKRILLHMVEKNFNITVEEIRCVFDDN